MAGNENSGRREKPSGVIGKAPPMGETSDEIREFMAWVIESVADDELDPRRADVMIKAARTGLAAVKDRDAASKIERLRKMLAEAKALADAGKAREAADRLHVSDDEDD